MSLADLAIFKSVNATRRRRLEEMLASEGLPELFKRRERRVSRQHERKILNQAVNELLLPSRQCSPELDRTKSEERFQKFEESIARQRQEDPALDFLLAGKKSDKAIGKREISTSQ